ncbi:hypothetical protein TNCV_939811 [Trichonephila clavipes]|nr:hypothetical protein TNCV_939811 [Trichonephila clavipes]
MYDYEIKYLKGSANIEADMLSRHPVAHHLQHSSHLLDINEIKTHQKNDNLCGPKYHEIKDLDEATDSNKDAHFIAYVRFWDEGLSTTEDESFIDCTSSGEIKGQFCNKTLFQFWAEVDDEFSELKTKAFRILLPFSTPYLCEAGFSAVAALKTKYRSQLNIEKELSVNF